MSRLYFKEQQRFKQWWIWILIIGITGLMLYFVIQQLILDKQVGDNPAPDVVICFFSILPFLMIWLFLSLKLETEIRKEGIYFRFKPFHRKFKFYPWDNISKYYVRKYRPILEYGGWGIRIGPGKYGKAYNVRGNMGLQLELKNGKRILIGTQKPEELERALNKFTINN